MKQELKINYILCCFRNTYIVMIRFEGTVGKTVNLIYLGDILYGRVPNAVYFLVISTLIFKLKRLLKEIAATLDGNGYKVSFVGK